MKIIDFEKKGNTIRFYLGKNNCMDYYGDDWDDAPYEHNAGKVYDEYIEDFNDITFPFDYLVLEPADGEFNSPYCKDDMKHRRVPCIIVVPKDKVTWHTNFSYYAPMEGIIHYYFGDTMEPEMTAEKYQELAIRTCGFDKKEDMLLNGAIGLAGETGEVADIIKKHIYHSKYLKIDDLILELGDVMWYIAEIAEAVGTNFNFIFEKNIEKLKERYPNGFPKN